MTAETLHPVHMRRPASSSHSITPTAKTSARRSTRSPRACSGARYAGLPLIVPSHVTTSESAALAMPKSTTLTAPPRVRITFCGVASR